MQSYHLNLLLFSRDQKLKFFISSIKTLFITTAGQHLINTACGKPHSANLMGQSRNVEVGNMNNDSLDPDDGCIISMVIMLT